MTSSQPNILLMIMDDQRADAIGALGHLVLKTPTLDQLVRQGTTFTRSFTTISICEPARAEVLTGCHSFHNGVTWFGQPIRSELKLLPQVLHDAGYHTMHVGKWHNDGHPRDRGYDRTCRVFHQDNLNHPRYQEFGHHLRFREGNHEVEGHSTELFVDAALEELHAAPQGRPWFMWLALHSPHDPFDCPEPFASMYDPKAMPLPENYMPEHPFDNGVMVIRDEKLLPWPRTQDAIRRYRARYYGMISHHDHHLGQVLKEINLQNTLVIFTSDHGLAVGSHGLLGKESMYDHSVRVPLLMAGPGIPSSKRVDSLVHHVDLLPTICEAAGIERPATAADGHNLLPLVRGEVPRVRDAVYGAFRTPIGREAVLRESQRMIRTERWKLIFYPLIHRYQLFDVQNDPHELYDLLQSWRLYGAPFGYNPPVGPEAALAIAEPLREQLLVWQKSANEPAADSVAGTPIAGTFDVPPVLE